VRPHAHGSDRLKRRLLNLLTLLSLLLCMAVVALWATRAHGRIMLFHGGGGIAGGSAVPTCAVFFGDGEIGLGWTRSDVYFEGQVMARLWLFVLATAALPAWWLARTLRQKPVVGCCPACGYDLRATPDRCPECGHTPAGANA
jgi:hypothetical protein